MKRFSCGDVVPGCVASFCADTDEDLLRRVAHHAHADHGISELRPELVESVKKHIHTDDRA